MSLHLPLLPRALRWCLVGTVAALVAYWSLATTPPTIGPSLAPAVPTAETPTSSGFDGEIPRSYVRHAVAYATLALTLAYALADREASALRKALLVFAVATGYGAAMEASQLFHADRTAALADVASNALGAAVALNWYGLERRVEFVPVGTADGDDRSHARN